MRHLDLTWYMLRLYHYRHQRLRLQIRCVRGWEVPLGKELRNLAASEGLTFSCRATRAGRLDVRRAASLVQFLRRLKPAPALARALDAYEAATALCRRGQPVSPELAADLARACRRVMALFPHPPGFLTEDPRWGGEKMSVREENP